jgi:Protein of unknown function (DUF1631)
MQPNTSKSDSVCRTDLHPRARQWLLEQLDECCVQLAPAVLTGLSALEASLRDEAEHATSNLVSQQILDQIIVIKAARVRAPQRLRESLETRLFAPSQSDTGDPEGLSLIEEEEFEESVLLDAFATRAEARNLQALFELGYRHAVLMVAPPVEAELNVFGPHAIGRGLRDVAVDLNTSHAQRVIFYRECERQIMGRLDNLYAVLNARLAAHGILAARLRPVLPASGAPTPAEPTSTQARTQPKSLADVRALLAMQQGVQLPLPPVAPGARTLTSEHLLDALLALQDHLPMASRRGAGHVPRTVHQLCQDILIELRTRMPTGQTPQLNDEQHNRIELVALLFDVLLSETRPGGHTQHLLARMEAPILRVALTDATFFSNAAHPARQLLATITAVADLWLDHYAGEADPALENVLQGVVTHALHDRSGNALALGKLAHQLDQHMSNLSRRAAIAERRQIAAAQGHDRLQQARRLAVAAIDQHLRAQPPPSPLIRSLLEHSWCDALALAILTHGEQSDLFRSRLAVVDALMMRDPQQCDDHRFQQALEEGLAQTGLHAAEARALTMCVLDRPPSVNQGAITKTEWLLRLKQRPRLGGGRDAIFEDDDGHDDVAPSNDAEQHQFAALCKVAIGTWFELDNEDLGRPTRFKLAWTSSTTGRCLLVGPRGNAHPPNHLAVLAKLLVSGGARTLGVQPESLTDRAWNAVVAMLRRNVTVAGRDKP